VSPIKDFEYSISADRHDTDGYRDHSSSWKEQQTAKINFKISDSTKLTVLANHFKSEAEDPLGLAIQDGFDQRKFNPYRYISSKGVLQTPVTDLSTNKYYSAFSSPKLAPDAAGLSNTRVSRSNTQVGLKLEHLLNDTNQIKLIAGVGHRDNLQYLALPITYGYADDSANSTIYTDTKTSYKSFSNIYASLADAKLAADNTKGRASSISRDYWNTEFSWTNLGELFSKKYSLTAGLAYGSMKDVRQDVNASGGQMMLTDTSPYSNPSGSTLTSFGQTLNNYQVNMNRDETDTAYNLDQFIQGKLSLKDSIDIHAGARHTYVSMDFKSKIPVTTSPSVNMNGAKSFERTTPVLGAIWKVNPTLNVYANYGEGFETPTLIEMAYNNASTATGPNLNLKPSWSNNYEIGAKAFILRNTS
jgi:iron complex outermembrane receptor protein